MGMSIDFDQGCALHVGIHELLGLFVGPPMVVGDDLELGTPGQEVFSRKV